MVDDMKCDESYRTPEWHRLRESMLGKWKSNPDWCINQLKIYVGNITTSHIGKICVVANYLTGSLFRNDQLPDATHEKVGLFRAQLFAEWKKRKINPGV